MITYILKASIFKPNFVAISFFSLSSDEQQQERPLGERIAVIVGCSKQKLDYKAPASELYQGDMFKKSKVIAIKLQADFYILSAKHGLITGSKIIEPYETVIQTKKDKDQYLRGFFSHYIKK